jgi:post-segregation antitoxin (ccd killing protein)
MTKTKVSATLDPQHLAEARALVGTDNISVVLDTALVALIERTLEQRWLAAHPDDDLPTDIPVELGDVPWDDE